MNFKRHVDFHQLVRITLIPLSIGLAAGIAGAITAEAWIAPRDLGFAAPLSMRPASSVTAPLPETEIASRLASADLPVYPKRVLRGGELADRFVAGGEAIGRASVLTSDGWLVTHRSAIPAGGVVVGVRGRLLEPERVTVDERTGAVFLKVDATALNVSGFEATETMREGSPLFSLEAGRMRRTFSSPGSLPTRRSRLDVLQSSDAYELAYPLETNGLPGSAVLTAGGNLAGIVAPAAEGERTVYIPMHQLSPVLSDIFRNQPIRRASFGANYLTIDGGALPGEGLPSAFGAIVTGSRSSGVPAVRSGSAAALAGLREGDVILRVDETALDGRDLAETLGDYRPGDKVRLTVQRAGAQVTLDAVLR